VQEAKASVTNAEMAQLMNMSTKVARAVEAWRSRKVGAGAAWVVPAGCFGAEGWVAAAARVLLGEGDVGEGG